MRLNFPRSDPRASVDAAGQESACALALKGLGSASVQCLGCGLLVFLLAGCGADGAGGGPGEGQAAAHERPWFRLLTGHRAIEFSNDRADHLSFFMPESMGPGFAVFDANEDGLPDIYVVNGYRKSDGSLDGHRGANRLYVQATDGSFSEVPNAGGLNDGGYGMGVALGDYDGDGHVDVYVTNYAKDALYRSLGGGRFVNVTDAVGLGCPLWGASAGFFDADQDGDLDLYVTNYVAYDPARMVGKDNAGRPEYPGPDGMPGLPDRLYINLGNGKFENATKRSGIGRLQGKSLGLAFMDLNHDGRTDIYVANDRESNFAWINQGDGQFKEDALRLGIALNEYGRPEASMGIAVGAVAEPNDLLEDLLLTHLVQESHTLYLRTQSKPRWRDETSRRGLGASTLDATGWGAAFGDLDLDGDSDLMVANGRVLRGLVLMGADHLPLAWQPYAEHDQLFINQGSGIWSEASEGICGDFHSKPRVGRGLALVDIDNDGDLDPIISNAEGSISLFENIRPRTGQYLKVSVRDPAGRTCIGTRLVLRIQDRSWLRVVRDTHGYLTSTHLPEHFGFPNSTSPITLSVTWPDSSTEQFTKLSANSHFIATKGQGH